VSALDDGWGQSLMPGSSAMQTAVEAYARGGAEAVRELERDELRRLIAETVAKPYHFWSGGRAGGPHSGHPISRADRVRLRAFEERLYVTRGACADCGHNRWAEDAVQELAGRPPNVRSVVRHCAYCASCGATQDIRIEEV